jgi:hypothetical protein
LFAAEVGDAAGHGKRRAGSRERGEITVLSGNGVTGCDVFAGWPTGIRWRPF